MGNLDAAEGRTREDFADLDMTYETVQPNRWTFQSDKIRREVEKRLRGRVLNACAGKTKLAHGGPIVRNDIDTARDADYYVDVCEISEHFEPASFDTIVYDPPFSENQASTTYELDDGTEVVAGRGAIAKREFHDLLADGGRVISFGFTTTNMPLSLGYTREWVGVFNTLGRMNDYLASMDVKDGEPEYDGGWFES